MKHGPKVFFGQSHLKNYLFKIWCIKVALAFQLQGKYTKDKFITNEGLLQCFWWPCNNAINCIIIQFSWNKSDNGYSFFMKCGGLFLWSNRFKSCHHANNYAQVCFKKVILKLLHPLLKLKITKLLQSCR